MATFRTAVLALSPTAYWRLGEPSGTNVADEMGVQAGTYVNTPTLGVGGYPGDGNTAATFAAASSQQVTIVDNAAWDVGTSDFSVMFAISISSWPGGSQWIFSRDWAAYLHSTTNHIEVFFPGGFFYNFTADTTLAGTGFHLIGISFDRSALATLTVDGVAEDTQDISGTVATDLSGTDGVYFATWGGGGGGYLDGTLDEVAFWKSTLISTPQWAELHASRNGSDVPPTTISYIAGRFMGR
jgi:hypothetical protein